MKRVLVISNSCFASSISNGRTLMGLFAKAEEEKLAQFFVYGKPDFKICKNHYRVRDKDALFSLIPFRACGGPVKQEDIKAEPESVASNQKNNKIPYKVLLRELVWLLGRWNNKTLKKWLDDFKPEAICIFVANNVFLLRLATQIAKRFEIPIVVYSTEAYYFMDYNYLNNRPSLVYKIYHAWLRAAYHKMNKYVTQGVFNSELLAEEYEKAFHYPCQCIMNSSKVDFVKNHKLEPDCTVKVSYLGNLGLNRHKALIEIAETLQELNPEYRLDVYGTAVNDAVEEELRQCDAINFHGFVGYDEVINIIHTSTLLLHTEWNDKLMNRFLKYGFSTKIADSVCSGTPLLVYASQELIEMAFLEKNKCAFLAYDKEMLKEVLSQALTDEGQREMVVNNAERAREKYFLGSDALLQLFM